MSRLAGAGSPRVVLVALGGPDRASSRIRVHDWVPRLEADGVACTVRVQYDPAWLEAGGISGRYPRLGAAARSRRFWREVLRVADGADAVLLQEAIPPAAVSRALGRRVGRIVFDFSDPVHAPGAPGGTWLHEVVHRGVVVPRLEVLLRVCAAVTVENDLLVDVATAAGCAVEVVRGPVDTARYHPSAGGAGDPAGRPMRLGWTGSRATLPYLERLVPCLNDLHRARGGVELVLFGVDRATGREEVPVRALPWDPAAEPEVVAGFDVGLNPLATDPWTRLRGGAKLLVYMACGVPVVSTPSGIGDQVVVPGETGFLADSDEAWRDALGRLLDAPELRRTLGARGRALAAERYSYDAYLPLMRRLLLG